MSARHGEVEAWPRSLWPSARPEARSPVPLPGASLVPGLDQTREVGLVAHPCSFVGRLLAGSSVTVGLVAGF
ncbi:hypothetical protein ABZ916_23935 [Streptomyces sp. NPDC046853]|uniref:hypothetical protein n=1 Tax=Streptomyces sp. NPDC046853 TaxID=3154920 RepID=UPI0033E1A041